MVYCTGSASKQRRQQELFAASHDPSAVDAAELALLKADQLSDRTAPDVGQSWHKKSHSMRCSKSLRNVPV
jgi:hypothetical protein